jgi:beta-lactamase class A
MGISEFYEFAPASLLKLPFALVYFMEKENGENIRFDQLITYSPTQSLPVQNFTSQAVLKEGESYSVEDLLRRMISYSDNNAYSMLAQYLDMFGRKDAVRNTLLEFGILLSDDPYDKSISVRRYASIFRGLYNSSLISSENSEKLLSWLSESDFKNGLLARLPENIVAAHKFGERDLEDGTKQLHDCGIIYYAQNPYLLCVMTHGRSYVDLEQVIQNISESVYREVDSRRL